MTFNTSNLHVTIRNGSFKVPEKISSNGYTPTQYVDGASIVVKNNSGHTLRWIKFDIYCYRDEVTRGKWTTTVSPDGRLGNHRPISKTRGYEIFCVDENHSIKNGQTESILVPRAGSWSLLRCYGETADGERFVHHYASGITNNLKTTYHSGECFVATAAYQDANHPMVEELRFVRDEIFARTSAGRSFIAAYYRHGPKLAAIVRPRPTLRLAARSILTPIAMSVSAARRVISTIKASLG
jgi:hypothetical protein